MNKETKKYLLSICIPTYNRWKELRRLISNIVNQKSFCEKVQIFVYDDPSDDDTADIVAGYMKQYNNIYYHRNNKRLWMMPSILDSIWKCSGEYVWLFWSDDIMWSWAIDTVLSIIRDKKPDLILNNHWKINNQNEAISKSELKIKYQMYSGISSFCNNSWESIKTLSNYGWMTPYTSYVSYFSYLSIYCFHADLFTSLYDEALLNKWQDYLNNNYFNYIYILLWGDSIQKICLCCNPILTYQLWWWARGWNMNNKILKDVYSIFKVISKKHQINIKTYFLFVVVFMFWLKALCIHLLISPWVSILKKLGYYNEVSYFRRKHILKN